MKKFRQYMLEDLTGALVEPQSAAAQQAKKLGLTYVGFGRYEDPRTQQVTHIVQNDRLVPFSKAIKTNRFAQDSGDDFGEYNKNLMPDVEQNHNDLTNTHLPEMYDDAELEAVENYTANSTEINNRLRSLPTGVPADQIEPMYAGDPIPGHISALDMALSKSVSPKDFLVYASLGNGFSIDSFQPGQIYQFRSFRSTTLDPNVAMNFASKYDQQPSRRSSFVLQIHVPKGSSGMYVNEYSTQSGEAEYVLPRGSAIQIVSGPTKMVGSNKRTNDMNQEVFLFVATVVTNNKKKNNK
jgi:hypothetical protein